MDDNAKHARDAVGQKINTAALPGCSGGAIIDSGQVSAATLDAPLPARRRTGAGSPSGSRPQPSGGGHRQCPGALEYLATLDDAAFGAASEVTPKFISRADPAAQWTGAHKGHAFFAYATNYLIDTEHAIILDVEASRAIRQAEVGASRTMLDRTAERFGLKPQSLVADSAYGSAEYLAWLVKQRGIAPHIPVFDKSNRTDGTFSRSDFVFDPEQDRYTCPEGKQLVQFHRTYATPRSGITKEGDTDLPRQQARLRCLCPQAQVLPEHPSLQDPAGHRRGCSRSGQSPGQHAGL